MLRNGTRYQDEIISPFRSLQYIFHITGIINQTGTLEITKRRQTVENIIDPVAAYQLVLPDKSGSKISAGIRILVLSHIHPGIPHRIIVLQTGIVHCKMQLLGSVQKVGFVLFTTDAAIPTLFSTTAKRCETTALSGF